MKGCEGFADERLAEAGAVLLAKLAMRVILTGLADALPRTDEIALDSHVLLFTLGIALLTGALFGAVPAIAHESRQGYLDTKREKMGHLLEDTSLRP